MKEIKRIGQWVLTFALLVTTSIESTATQVASSELYVTGASGATVFSDYGSTTRTGTDTATFGYSPNISYVNPSVHAVAQPGTLKAYAHADSIVPNDGSLGFSRRTMASRAGARWTTTASVTAPGIAAGLTGTGTVSILLNGSFSYDATGTVGYYLGTGYATQRLTVSGTQGEVSYDGRYQLNNGIGYFDVNRTETGQAEALVFHDTNPGAAGGFGFSDVIEVDFTFITGQPVAIDAQLNVFGRSLSSGGGSGVDWFSDAGNSAYWLGLTNVMINGVAVTDYSFIDSTTGVDLSMTAVPLPASAGLFAGGLLFFIGLARRKRTHDLA